jgi:phosphoribosylanthranilate isomerase
MVLSPDNCYPKIKICGLTRVEDLLACYACGVDYVGLNFFPKSKRYITLEKYFEMYSDHVS